MNAKDWKIKKINRTWYRIVLEIDEFALDKDAIEIVETQFGEWSVQIRTDIDDVMKPRTYGPDKYVFIKLRTAKAFAKALADYVESGYSLSKEPKIYDDKFVDLDVRNPRS